MDGQGIGSSSDNSEILNILNNRFGSRDELIGAVKRFYFKKGYALSIKNSKKDKYLSIGCDRGGQYRDKKKIPIEKCQRKTKTRLVNCPFKIHGKREADGCWVVLLKNELHNHDASIDMSGHPSARVLSNQEIEKLDHMTRAGIPPRQILSSLRKQNPGLKAVSRTIYNAKGKIQRESLAGRSSIQVLYDELGKGGFIFDVVKDIMGRLTHLFFIHPTSIKLSQSYSNVFVMDCTYKINRYNMPLLEIIGVTSFNTSFVSGFAFLKSEGHEDYAWALEAFSKVLGQDCKPSVIVTDRDLALMKAVKIIFPKAANLVCVWHIEKNILSNCKSSFEKKEDFDVFLLEWNNVVYSSTEEDYLRVWKGFETLYEDKGVVLNYIRKTWLPYIEYFVSAWTEKYLHYGNRVTSRAEGAHSKLKKYFLVSSGDLRSVKYKMCLLIDNDRQEVRTKLSRERIVIPHTCNIPFFKEVVTRISSFALEKLHEQYTKVLKHSLKDICSGEFIATMGLPCAHMMIHWKDSALPLGAIHSQWRIDIRSALLIDNSVTQMENDFSPILTEVHAKYRELPLSEKEYTCEKLSQFLSDSTPLLFEPNVQNSKGRPSTSKKRKAASSTVRDPSKFEVVDASRKCSTCRNSGHNSRTCPTRGENNIPITQSSNLTDGGIGYFDLNVTPDHGNNSFSWDFEFDEKQEGYFLSKSFIVVDTFYCAIVSWRWSIF